MDNVGCDTWYTKYMNACSLMGWRVHLRYDMSVYMVMARATCFAKVSCQAGCYKLYSYLYVSVSIYLYMYNIYIYISNMYRYTGQDPDYLLASCTTAGIIIATRHQLPLEGPWALEGLLAGMVVVTVKVHIIEILPV